jgi:hypothetical protein
MARGLADVSNTGVHNDGAGARLTLDDGRRIAHRPRRSVFVR